VRILSICYEYPPVGGGGATVASALNAQLAANGHTVEVVTSGMKGLLASEFSEGVWIHRAPCWRRHRHYTTAPELATTLLPAFLRANALIRRQMPDVIHAHFALPSGLVARALSARHGIPYVLTAHGSDIPGYNPDRFDLLHRALKPVWRSVMHGAAAVLSPSQFLASLIRTHSDVPVQVIANGYNSDAASANGDGASYEANLPRPKRNLILVVARLFPRKGVQHFIDSVAALGEDWEMVVAGDGPYLPELRTRASNANAHIRFAGFVAKPELRTLYEEARILVFPSIRENFPMVLLEGMDAGCAVITTDAEGCAEVVGNAGVVIEKGKPAPLRAALVDLMNDPQRCEALGALAMARAERFRWPRIAGHYERVFDAVAKRVPLQSLALDPPAAP
jgi:glycosyltransferase involved in cell wall biosynthesis